MRSGTGEIRNIWKGGAPEQSRSDFLELLGEEDLYLPKIFLRTEM